MKLFRLTKVFLVFLMLATVTVSLFAVGQTAENGYEEAFEKFAAEQPYISEPNVGTNGTYSIAPGLTPCIGTPKLVVFVIDFLNDTVEDSNWTKNSVDDIEKGFFSDSEVLLHEWYSGDSLRNFYYRSSYGKLDIKGDAFPYITKKERSQYENADQIMYEVMEYAGTEDSLDWSQYDSNGDGYIDGVYFVLRNHPAFYSPNFVSTCDFVRGGKKIQLWCFTYGHGHVISVGTLAHEHCHMMGFHDMYGGHGFNSGGTWATDIMNNGPCTGDIPGIMKYIFGWIEPQRIFEAGKTQMALSPISDEPDFALIHVNADKDGLDILIAEYKTSTNNDIGLGTWAGLAPSGGILIWRIKMDTRFFTESRYAFFRVYDSDHQTNVPHPKNPYTYIETVHPEGVRDYYFYSGDSLTPYTTPNSNYPKSLINLGGNKKPVEEADSGIHIENIQIENGKAYFDLTIDEAVTVTYNYSENGGVSATKVTDVLTQGQAVDLSVTATKSGWNFVGWNTNKDATVGLTSLTAGTSDITLYAIYSKELIGTFIDYSGTTKQTRTSSVTIYNKATSGNITAPMDGVYTGWTSCGWSISTAANAVSNTTFTISADTTFYGLYQRTLTLSYNANGGSETPDSQTGTQYVNSYANTVYHNPTFVLAAKPNRIGSIFTYWAKDHIGGLEYDEFASITIDADTTMYALWITYNITVTYNYSENEGTSATKNSDYIGQYQEIDLTPTATKSDWNFVGWNTNKNATIGLTSLMAGNSDIILYAIYSKALTGTFIDYSGTTKQTRTESVTIYNKATSGNIIAPMDGVYTGWVSRGWGLGTSADAAVVASSGTVYNISADTTFYGLYQRTLMLSYNANGGSETPNSQNGIRYVNSYANTIYVNPTLVLASEVNRDGHTFKKWAQGSISGTQYSAGASITIDADTTMYALWTETTLIYTVTFINYDGTVLKIENVESGIAATAPANPTKEGNAQYSYKFAGWDEKFDNITGDLTVTAIFEQTVNSYTVTFKNWDGTVLKIETVQYSGSATAPSNLVRGNDTQYSYTFKCWDKEFNNVTGNLTVTAEYTQKLILGTDDTDRELDILPLALIFGGVGGVTLILILIIIVLNRKKKVKL